MNDVVRDGSPSLGGKYLTFRLHDEEYGFRILQVQEIIGMQQITPLPNTPESILGVINLRGKVIPIIDLRRRFGLEPKPADAETCIIVVDADGRQTGFVVDGVHDVADIAGASIDPAPELGPGVRTDFILGMGKVDNGVKILLDVETILAAEDIATIGAEG